jgi:hypothetical protein
MLSTHSVRGASKPGYKSSCPLEVAAEDAPLLPISLRPNRVRDKSSRSKEGRRDG